MDRKNLNPHPGITKYNTSFIEHKLNFNPFSAIQQKKFIFSWAVLKQERNSYLYIYGEQLSNTYPMIPNFIIINKTRQLPCSYAGLHANICYNHRTQKKGNLLNISVSTGCFCLISSKISENVNTLQFSFKVWKHQSLK